MAKPKPGRGPRPGKGGGRTSTPALVAWAVAMLLLGLGLGALLTQQGCDRKAKGRLPEGTAPAPPRKEPEPRKGRLDAPRPEPAKPETAKPEPKASGKEAQPALPALTLIIDDLGYAAPELVTRLVAQPIPLTVAVLPYQEHTRESAEIAFKAGKEVILHLPMEGRAEKDPGPDALRFDLPEAELRARTRKALKDVPYIKGANNHMGSRMTADRDRMRWILEEFKGRPLYFVDSRTTKDTVAWEVAQGLGIATVQRNVFLDDDKTFAEIQKQWERALALAKKEGSAVVIGHIYPETVEALEKLIPATKGQVRFLRAGEAVH